MKKTLLTAIAVLTLTGSVQAAQFESVFLSSRMNECVKSMNLTTSHLTPRIKEDEKLGFTGWINPFRNIDRSIRSLEEKPLCYEDYVKFTDRAIKSLNIDGRIAVYGKKVTMGYFTENDEFYYGGE